MKQLMIVVLYVFTIPAFAYGNSISKLNIHASQCSVDTYSAYDLEGTIWSYEDANGQGILFSFVDKNWVKVYRYKKNDNMQSEWDNYYVLLSENLYTYKMDNSNNSGDIWIEEGDWREQFGHFVISGNTLGFTNKKGTMRLTFRKTTSVPDCINM